MKRTLMIAVILAAFGGFAVAQQTSTTQETKQHKDARMAWWRDARFGMFIHWGLYAIPAGEWEGTTKDGVGEWIMNNRSIPIADYEKLLPQFNPVKFDAAKWVDIAKNAGVKYIVITSKHHDGFALFDSKVTTYSVMATPFKRDVMKELSDAARAAGLKICWYHSIMDWHHPEAQGAFYPKYNDGKRSNPFFDDYRESYLKPMVRELLTNYGQIGVMWFDGEWIADWNDDKGRDLYNLCREVQPGVIVNNRVAKGRKGMAGVTAEGAFAGDYDTPEQQIPATGIPGADWETCMTMNDTWGFKKSDKNWKTTETLVKMLIDTASKGGNFLLNVGPTAEGEIPAESAERLGAIGDWLKDNAEAIYGTTASPFPKLEWGKATKTKDKLYLFVYDWPKDGTLVVPIKNGVRSARILGFPDAPIGNANGPDGVELQVGPNAPNKIATVIELEPTGPLQVITK